MAVTLTVHLFCCVSTGSETTGFTHVLHVSAALRVGQCVQRLHVGYAALSGVCQGVPHYHCQAYVWHRPGEGFRILRLCKDLCLLNRVVLVLGYLDCVRIYVYYVDLYFLGAFMSFHHSKNALFVCLE